MAPGSAFTRPRMIAAGVLVAVSSARAFAFPAIRRWARADRAVDAHHAVDWDRCARRSRSRRFGAGPRRRGAASDALQSGAGHRLAADQGGQRRAQRRRPGHHRRPELHSALEQSRAQLLSLRTDLERQKIVGSQSRASRCGSRSTCRAAAGGGEARADAPRRCGKKA